MVHGDHASIWHRYGDMAPQIMDARTWKKRRKNRNRKEKGKRKEKEKQKGKRKGKVEGRNVRRTDARTDAPSDALTHGHSGDFILCPMLCIALDRQQLELILLLYSHKLCSLHLLYTVFHKKDVFLFFHNSLKR